MKKKSYKIKIKSHVSMHRDSFILDKILDDVKERNENPNKRKEGGKKK
jgi:hypothetical protein